MFNRGYYNGFGGAYLPEILVATFDELEKVFQEAKNDPDFWPDMKILCPLIHAVPHRSLLLKI
jgi:tryptophan synthase beta chain